MTDKMTLFIVLLGVNTDFAVLIVLGAFDRILLILLAVLVADLIFLAWTIPKIMEKVPEGF